MSQVQHSEQNPITSLEAAEIRSLEAAEKYARRLEKPEKLMKASETAQGLIPEGTVVGNCGSVSLTLFPTRGGFGRITVGINSFLGPISAVSFFGEWVRLGFPPAFGVMNSSNTQIFNLNGVTSNVVLVCGIIPGRFKVFANLTYLLVTTAGGQCIGLLPSDVKQF